MLVKVQYSPDSLRRYIRVLDGFSEYAGEKLYSQPLGAEFLAMRFNQTGGFVTAGAYSKDEMCYFRATRSLAEYFNFGVIFRRKGFSWRDSLAGTIQGMYRKFPGLQS